MDEGCCGCKHTPLWFFILLSFCMWLFTDAEASERHETDHHVKVLTATQQQVHFLLWLASFFKSLYCHSFFHPLWKRVNEREEQRKCAVALCLSFASHSKWRLWLSCSNWTLLQIRRANNGPLWWMGRVAVCAVVSSERNRYAISDESHAKSHGCKEL